MRNVECEMRNDQVQKGHPVLHLSLLILHLFSFPTSPDRIKGSIQRTMTSGFNIQLPEA